MTEWLNSGLEWTRNRLTQETSTTSARQSEYSLAGSEIATEHFNRRTISRDAALVVPHLRAGMRLVDFGCGAGSLTCGFAELVAPSDVVGFDTSEEAIGRARALAEETGLRNVQFAVANIYDLVLPAESFDVAHFSGVLIHLKEPEQALGLAFRTLKSGGMLAAREAQKAGDWFGGPRADSVALFQRLVAEFFKMHGGDPSIGGRLIALAREAGFERLEATPSYSAGLADVRKGAPEMISFLGRADFRAVAFQAGVPAERYDRLADEIAIWGGSADSIAAFAECTVIGWKP
jgi:2-polyprenyl-3-methyl-5-hydroxy-6-metoxy-1,4-benzoquinol methylase